MSYIKRDVESKIMSCYRFSNAWDCLLYRQYTDDPDDIPAFPLMQQNVNHAHPSSDINRASGIPESILHRRLSPAPFA